MLNHDVVKHIVLLTVKSAVILKRVMTGFLNLIAPLIATKAD